MDMTHGNPHRMHRNVIMEANDHFRFQPRVSKTLPDLDLKLPFNPAPPPQKLPLLFSSFSSRLFLCT